MRQPHRGSPFDQAAWLGVLAADDRHGLSLPAGELVALEDPVDGRRRKPGEWQDGRRRC